MHGIWIPGPGCYGRNDAGDAAMDAALLAKAVGKPVRLQYMRDQATGWDPKGPASIHRARAAIDASGKVIAYEFMSRGLPRVDVNSNESQPYDTLAGQLTGVALKSGDGFAVPQESYGFDNKYTYWETVPPLLDRGSPLRTSHLRDPVGPQIHFASESFMDEVAAALNMDPVAFRLQYVQRPARYRRDQGGGGESRLAIAAVAAQGPEPATRSPAAASPTCSAARRASPSSPKSISTAPPGKIWARKFTVAHDCGQIINPDGLRLAIEGNVVQGVSRTLWEEVKFDAKAVTSVDWMTYPILDITETPETIDVGADRPSGDRAVRRRRALDPSGRGGHRQRGLRRHRRAHPPCAVLAGQRQIGAVVKKLPLPASRGRE